MRKILVLLFMTAILVSVSAVIFAQSNSPAQYCKQFELNHAVYNACTVCAAHGSPVPFGDGPVCICKTLQSGFAGPSPFKSMGECLQAVK